MRTHIHYLGLIAILVLTVYFQYRYVNAVEVEGQSLRNLVISKLKVTTLENGSEKAVIPVAQLGEETLRQILRIQFDSLRTEFKANTRNVQQYVRLISNTKSSKKIVGKDTVYVLGTDTIKITVFEFKDRFLTRNDTLEADSLRTNIDFRNDIQILVRKGKRENPWKFWKKRPLVGEVYSGNPYTRIKDFQILKVIDK